eukprot:SAG31_NODE_10016_length_1195_cov_1.555657_1_plen_177_part_00
MAELDTMSYKELQAMAKERGLKANGSAIALRQRLSEAIDAEVETAVPMESSPFVDKTNAMAPKQQGTPAKQGTPSKYLSFQASAPEIHSSPMVSASKKAAGRVDESVMAMASEDGDGATSDDELPSPINEEGLNKIPDDGTFLATFLSMQKEHEQSEWEEPVRPLHSNRFFRLFGH